MWLPGEDGGSDGAGHGYAVGFIDDDYRPTPNVQKMGFRFETEKGEWEIPGNQDCWTASAPMLARRVRFGELVH